MTADIEKDRGWREAELADRIYFCKVNLRGKVFLGIVKPYGKFGEGSLFIPVDGDPLAKHNSKRITDQQHIDHELGMYAGANHGELDIHVVNMGKCLTLRLARTRPMTHQTIKEDNLEKQAGHGDYKEHSVSELVDYINSLPNLGMTVSPLSTEEYPTADLKASVFTSLDPQFP